MICSLEPFSFEYLAVREPLPCGQRARRGTAVSWLPPHAPPLHVQRALLEAPVQDLHLGLEAVGRFRQFMFICSSGQSIFRFCMHPQVCRGVLLCNTWCSHSFHLSHLLRAPTRSMMPAMRLILGRYCRTPVSVSQVSGFRL